MGETLAHLGETRDAYRILVGKAEGKKHFGYPWLI
jgi:hypothetical protein